MDNLPVIFKFIINILNFQLFDDKITICEIHLYSYEYKCIKSLVSTDGSIMSEFLRISRCTLLYSDFLPFAIALFKRMINQGGSDVNILNQITKVIRRHPISFEKYGRGAREITTKDISSD